MMPALQMGDQEHSKIRQILAAGFDWHKLVEMLAQYGPQVLDLILKILAERKANTTVEKTPHVK